MTYYIGNENGLDSLIGPDNRRFFLALRRTDDGTLYFGKIDQISDSGALTINDPGLVENDYTDFEYGVDFFDGRQESDHSRPYLNLHWDQYRWDNKNVYYYIDGQGNFVVRINQAYSYSAGSQIS
jgi:hypothetical protein